MDEGRSHTLERNLVRAWFVLHCITLVSILFGKSPSAVIFDQYSKRSFAILVFFSITLPVIWGITRWLVKNAENIDLSQAAYKLLFVTCIASLIGIWAFHIGPTRGYAVARLYVTLVVFTVGVWSVRYLELPAWGAYLPRLVGIISIVFLFVLTMGYPALKWTDEGFAANAAWSSAQTGKTTISMFEPGQEMEAVSMMYRGLGLWFEQFGISLASARVFTFALAVTALAISFVTARKLFGETEAWTAVIVGAFGFISINYLHQDVEAAVWLAVAYALFVVAEQTGKPWLHVLVGLAVALSVDGHPIAYRFGLAFG
ncbi:MAG: hypothetical protein JW910_16575, partial [Anaerolineae bacterium]|nr:hypothetical protein [Anaerolineae bacterium]